MHGGERGRAAAAAGGAPLGGGCEQASQFQFLDQQAGRRGQARGRPVAGAGQHQVVGDLGRPDVAERQRVLGGRAAGSRARQDGIGVALRRQFHNGLHGVDFGGHLQAHALGAADAFH
ncbi:hypothetical protein G6F23_014203 [Rhizopus arrhizus]|nr:hypothetical protein G6F23_014203 [Rhizopus arrhizus]